MHQVRRTWFNRRVIHSEPKNRRFRPWHDLKNEVISREPKIIETQNFQSTCKKDQTAAIPNFSFLAQKMWRAARWNHLGGGGHPPMCGRGLIKSELYFYSFLFILFIYSSIPPTGLSTHWQAKSHMKKTPNAIWLWQWYLYLLNTYTYLNYDDVKLKSKHNACMMSV